MSEQFNPVDWVSSKQAEDLTGYSRHTFIKAVKKGVLESIKLGNMRFYKRDDILEYVRRMKELGNQKHTPKKYRRVTETA